MKETIHRIGAGEIPSRQALITLLHHRTREEEALVFALARQVREQVYGRDIFIRGLIEISSYCRRNCYYCGIRRDNQKAQRYRLTLEEILDCCREGYALGFRTFVLQGGEDPYFTTQRVEEIITTIKGEFPHCAITLSIGERPQKDYALWRKAGADRYLLRHETATPFHFSQLHPPGQTLAKRKAHLSQLKELGYQVGTGFMVGSPYQTKEHLAEDLLYLLELQPDMVGIGPYVVHRDTPFWNQPSGSAGDTLFLLGLLRLLLPYALLPATTSLATLEEEGTTKGFLAGANVVMPNLSPLGVREKYALYQNKKNTGTQGGESLELLHKQAAAIGYQVVCARGDVASVPSNNT